MVTHRLRLIIIFAIGLFFSACSEQTKIEKSLIGQDGRWDVDEITITTTIAEPDEDNIVLVEQVFNSGEILFYSSGSGIWISYDTLLLVDVARYFEWENTENTVLLDFGLGVEDEFTIAENEDDRQLWTIDSSALVGDITTTIATEIVILRVDEQQNN